MPLGSLPPIRSSESQAQLFKADNRQAEASNLRQAACEKSGTPPATIDSAQISNGCLQPAGCPLSLQTEVCRPFTAVCQNLFWFQGRRVEVCLYISLPGSPRSSLFGMSSIHSTLTRRTSLPGFVKEWISEHGALRQLEVDR